MSDTIEPKRIVRSLRELSHAVEPARDLWPGIASQLQPRRRSWAVPAGLAAGFVLAMALAIGVLLRHSGAVPDVVGEQGGVIRAAFMADPDYQHRRDELLKALPRKLDALPQESQQRVRDSLAAIETAMRDIQTELGRDSGNVILQEMLISTSQEEMRVLTAISEADGQREEI